MVGKRIKYVIDRNVSKDDILIDDGGLDTYSTVYRCKNAFPDKKFIVCTQKKYFKRTGYLIKKASNQVMYLF